MINIAIDGPSGAGKSTMARAVAEELKYIYVDTGALYRAVGLYAYEKGANTKEEKEVAPLLSEIDLKIKYINDIQRVFVNGRDVSEDIRKPEMSMATSNVSTISQVRDFLFELQRKIATENNVVMDGRDIGTVVLPDAEVKIYLTASPECRAKRRYEELRAKNEDVDYNFILEDIKKRDYQDMTREIAPLKKAEDAIVVDTSDMTKNEVVQCILKIVKEKTA